MYSKVMWFVQGITRYYFKDTLLISISDKQPPKGCELLYITSESSQTGVNPFPPFPFRAPHPAAGGSERTVQYYVR